MFRQCKLFSLKDKIEILKEFAKTTGLTKVELAKNFNMPVFSLKTVTKKIEAKAADYRNSASKKLHVHKGKFSVVENILIKIFTKYHAQTCTWADLYLWKKQKNLNVRDSCFSTGRRHKFKMRHRIPNKVISRESKDVPAEKIEFSV